MDKRSRRRFTNEFKAETVALVRHSGKSIAEVLSRHGPGGEHSAPLAGPGRD